MKEEKEFEDESDEESEDSIWAEGSFVQTMSAEEAERKKTTINKAHDENMNFDCKKCGKKISAHNNDWHDGMCDECFDKEYFSQ